MGLQLFHVRADFGLESALEGLLVQLKMVQALCRGSAVAKLVDIIAIQATGGNIFLGMNKQLIQVFGIVAALFLLWWLWPAGDTKDMQSKILSGGGERELVSAIQPIPDDNFVVSESKITGVLDQGDALLQADSQISSRFQNAITLASQGNRTAAIQILESLITNHPKLIEPYINLASLLADQGQLEQARETLVQGINANTRYATLLSNLQKVNGSLAAKAYQLATIEDERSATPIELQYASKLDFSADHQQKTVLALRQIEDIKKQLDLTNTKLASSDKLLSDKDNELLRVSTQLTQTQQQLQSQDDVSAQQSANTLAASSALQQELDKARLRIKNLQSEYQAEVASLLQQIEQQNTLAENPAANLSDQQAPVEQGQDSAQPLAINAVDQTRKDQAAVIDLIKSWAKAWSTQQVDGYLEHYVSDYAPPGSSLSHSQWVRQRKIRLGNKSFIQVTVSDFNVQLVNGQYAAVFSQHYRSNTMDDVIRKQLKFSVDDGDWSQSKIVSEQVL